MDLGEKLTKVMQEGLKGSRVELEMGGRTDQVSGVVVWEGFQNMEPIDRQGLIWDLLESGFTEQERDLLGPVLSITPNELAAIRED